ncbi:uncharacterized protein [Euphorbia lathyris]|uniref:uncharacterized protein isoform X2 n=1 Tax=Euphorbia lathyris TaxID=212925 RepID=UPI003313AFFD
MDSKQELLGNNCIEDVRWLCSLSESELRRAKVIGHEELAKKFNLKVFRALALVLMEHTKDNIKKSSLALDLAKSDAFMDGCGLLQCKLAEILSIEELLTCIGLDGKKR